MNTENYEDLVPEIFDMLGEISVAVIHDINEGKSFYSRLYSYVPKEGGQPKVEGYMLDVRSAQHFTMSTCISLYAAHLGNATDVTRVWWAKGLVFDGNKVKCDPGSIQGLPDETGATHLIMEHVSAEGERGLARIFSVERDDQGKVIGFGHMYDFDQVFTHIQRDFHNFYHDGFSEEFIAQCADLHHKYTNTQVH